MKKMTTNPNKGRFIDASHLHIQVCCVLALLLFSVSAFSQGETCATAELVSEGSHMANGPSSGEGALQICQNEQGVHANWYIYTPTEDGNITISSCGSLANTQLSILSGSCDDLTCEGVNDNALGCLGLSSRLIDVPVYEDETYYIQWDNKWSEAGFEWSLEFEPTPLCTPPSTLITSVTTFCENGEGTFDIEVSLGVGGSNPAYLITNDQNLLSELVPLAGSVVFGGFEIGTTVTVTATAPLVGDCTVSAEVSAGCVPANDEPCAAIALTCDEETSGSTSFATESLNVGFPICSTGAVADVFYKFMAEPGNIYTVSVNGDNYDGVLGLYQGDCSGDLIEFGCADNGLSDGILEDIEFEVNVEQEIFIQTYDWSFGGGEFTLSITCEEAPEFDCPIAEVNIGDSCDDLDPTTENDIYGSNCICAGSTIVEVPANDFCADATELTVNLPGECVGNEETGTTYGATNVENIIYCEGDNVDVYYSFNSGSYSNVILNISLGTATDIVTNIIEGDCTIGSSNCIYGTNSIAIETEPNTDFIVRISTNTDFGDVGTFTICAEGVAPFDCPLAEANIGDSCNDLDPTTENDIYGPDCVCAGSAIVELPSNDFCADATALTLNLPGECLGNGETGTTYGATNVENIIYCEGDNVDVYYSFNSGFYSNVILNISLGTATDIVTNIIEGDCTIGSSNCIYGTNSIPVETEPNTDFIVRISTNTDFGDVGTFTICAEGVAPFDCPLVEANIGDSCDDLNPSTENDAYNANCECAGTPVIVFDCPLAQANIGDSCDDLDPTTENDMYNANCECAGTPVIVFDCPLAQANIGDSCDDLDLTTENDAYNANCECAGTPVIVFDCPLAQANIGDSCDDLDLTTENDAYNANCECAGTPVIVFDCPLAQANIGDSCDDLDASTENDAYNANCECAGNPIITFDCEELMADLGDACNDGNANTENDVLVDNCMCLGTPISVNTDCDDYAYYLSDVSDSGASDIYKIDIDGATMEASLTLLKSLDYQVHIAFNEADALLYLVRTTNGSFRSLDVSVADGELGEEIALDMPLSNAIAAAINADGKLVIADQNSNEITAVNLVNGVGSPYATGNVSGGDVAFGLDGRPYLATRSGGILYQINPGMANQMLGNVPGLVTGMAVMSSGNLLFSAKGAGQLVGRTDNGVNNGVAFDLFLNGEPFTTNNGDLASGCADGEAVIDGCNYKLYYTHQPVGGAYSLLEMTLNNDGTATHNELLSGLGSAHIALSPDGGTIYIVGSNLKTYDVATGTVTSTVAITGVSGNALSGFPAAVTGADGTLYVARNNKVYTLAPDGTATQFGPNRNVSGGDLVFIDGELYIVTRNNKFTNVLTGASFTVEISEMNGATMLENGNVLVADGNGAGLFKELDLATLEVVATYETGLALNNGDLAGRCIDGENQNDCGETGQCYPSSAIYVQGTTVGGGAIDLARADVNQSLGEPERTDDFIFTSLGYGGSLTFEFDGNIPNGEGDDIEIVEVTFNNSIGCDTYPEFGDVSVSQDNLNFFFVGTVCKSDRFVDISNAVDENGNSVDLECVLYIRVANNDELSTTGDGFDVDGIVALHNCDASHVSNNYAASTLTSYPNPTTGNSQVIFVTAETARTTVEVFDMNGKSVGTVFNQEAQQGQEYRLDFNGSDLPNGLYIYRMTTNNETLINKMLIAR